MTQTLLIDHIEIHTDGTAVCFFSPDVYKDLQEKQGESQQNRNPGQGQSPAKEWKPLDRVLADSDSQQFVYVVDTGGVWTCVRFPEQTWPAIENIVQHQRTVYLAVHVSESGEVQKSMPLTAFWEESLEMIRNIRDNANYGSQMCRLADRYFPDIPAQWEQDSEQGNG